MKRSKTDLIFPIIGVVIIIQSLLKDGEKINFLGTEMNVWIYRGIWIAMIIIGIFRYLNPNRKQ